MIGISSTDFPNEYSNQIIFWQNNAQSIINDYTTQKTSFLHGCQPNLAIQMPTTQIIYILTKRFGEEKVRQCLNPDHTFTSPISEEPDSEWLKSVTMVGVNVRTIGSFWSLVKYAMTLPSAISSVHLLPIWECGVVASLYGMASWHINPEFFDYDLSVQFPLLNSIEKQLKVAVNLLHLMGKTVGFDVVPHSDRYSEIVLANPYNFEWLKRKEFKIVDHSDHLPDKVAARIVEFININGSVSGDYFSRNYKDFFDNSKNSEEVRLRILFGNKENKDARNHRRNALISYLFEKGYEPAPATMAPPYRGLIVDQSEEAKTVDNEGRVWRDYIIEKPQEMSRVFGPLARYKLYKSKDHNLNWELDFNKPRTEIFEYVGRKYLEVCQNFNFDFMRGDMSHVQMNPNVTTSHINEYYDIHKFVKNYIKKVKPSFGYFAESFLVADNLMAYGNEAKHLEYSDTDSTLGNLQSFALTNSEFYQEFTTYFKLANANHFKPNFTVITGDKDDPRFDSFYLEGNGARYFISMFFKYFPSYYSLGFELRDINLTPAPNENYTKLYVFQLNDGPKSTSGPYRWGKNGAQFSEIQAINLLSDQVFEQHKQFEFSLISKIEKFEKDKILIWKLTIGNKSYLFLTCLAIASKTQHYDMKDYPNAKLVFENNCQYSEKMSISLHKYSYAIFEI